MKSSELDRWPLKSELPTKVMEAVRQVLDSGGTARVSKDHNGKYHVHIEKIERVYVSE